MSSTADGNQPANWSGALGQFCELYPAIKPKKDCSADESLLLSRDAGLCRLSCAPLDDQLTFVHDVPRSGSAAEEGRHLWAICPVEVRYALEATQIGELNLIKHSNLTAAGPAICAGEIWFIEQSRFGFNGNSGRYGIEDPSMLKNLEDLFIKLGYTVASTGFDDDAGRCRPHFTEEKIQWRSEI